jgi:hypothetical protein
MKSYFAIIFSSLFFVCCGKDVSTGKSPFVESNSPNTSGGGIKSFESIPYPCDTAVQGNIIFLRNSGFRICNPQNEWQPIDLKGEAGVQGPQGFAGPKGGSTLVAVYDAKDRKIGWLMQQPATLAVRKYHVLLTSGASVDLMPNGYISASAGFPWSSSCVYQSTDCTGVCRATVPLAFVPIESEVVGNNSELAKSMYFSSNTDLGPFTYASAKYNGICGTAGQTIPSSFAVAPLVLESGAAYPFEGPISLRAE